MKLRRRDFVRVGGCGIASLMARSLWAQAGGQDESPPAPRVVLTWGTNGHGDGEFDIPIAVAVNQKDEVLVTDFRQGNAEAKSRVQRFDQEGRFLGAFETDPMPGGLALDKDGLLYVTHMMKHKVAVYDPAGKLVREFGKQGAAPGSLTSRAVSPWGEMDRSTSPIRRTDACSDYHPKACPLALGASTAWRRANLAETHLREAVVAGRTSWPSTARATYTPQRLPSVACRSSTPTARFCSPGEITKWRLAILVATRDMPGPLAIAVDHKDQVWVTSTNHYVHQFTPEGRFVCRVGGEGTEPGQFRLPHGLAFDSQHYLYVADARNSRIQKLAI